MKMMLIMLQMQEYQGSIIKAIKLRQKILKRLEGLETTLQQNNLSKVTQQRSRHQTT